MARLPSVYLRVHELAARGRESELFECLREGARRLDAAVGALARVERAEEFARAWPHIALFAAFSSCALAVLGELVAAETADQAEPALDRLRAAVYAG